MSENAHHVVARLVYDQGTLEEVLDIACVFPRFQGASSTYEQRAIARQRNLVANAVCDGLVSGEYAHVAFPEGALPEASQGRCELTARIALEHEDSIDTALERLATDLDGFHARFRVVEAEIEAPARRCKPVRDMSFRVGLRVVGKPNPLEIAIAAPTSIEAAHQARDFVRKHRPDLTDQVLITTDVSPNVNDLFHVQNQCYPAYQDRSNYNTHSLIEQVLADEQELDSLRAGLGSESLGIPLSELCTQLHGQAAQLREQNEQGGPINWHEVAAALETSLFGYAVTPVREPIDSRSLHLQTIDEAFEWKDRQRRVLDALQPTESLLQRLGITPAAQSAQAVQALVASEMLLALSRNIRLNPADFDPTPALEALMKREGKHVLDGNLIEEVMYADKTPQSIPTEEVAPG